MRVDRPMRADFNMHAVQRLCKDGTYCNVHATINMITLCQVPRSVQRSFSHMDPWLRELVPVANASQDAGSRNLGPTFFTFPVYNLLT